jgi:predicted AAA+ superfamily ATPase
MAAPQSSRIQIVDNDLHFDPLTPQSRRIQIVDNFGYFDPHKSLESFVQEFPQGNPTVRVVSIIGPQGTGKAFSCSTLS